MREARIPFSFLHNKRISYRGVTRDFSREREREFSRRAISRHARVGNKGTGRSVEVVAEEG